MKDRLLANRGSFNLVSRHIERNAYALGANAHYELPIQTNRSERDVFSEASLLLSQINQNGSMFVLSAMQRAVLTAMLTGN